MPFVSITKPLQGTTTRKSQIDAIIDDLAFLFGSIGTISGVLNGSFEDDTDGDGVPDEWTKTLYTGGTFAIDTTDQQHGEASAKFVHPGGGGNGGGYLESSSFLPCSPNRPIEVLWELKCSAAGVSVKVELFWFKSDQTASTTPSTAIYNSTANPTSWTGLSASATPPSDARFCKLRLTGGHNGVATAGTVRFDDVLLRLKPANQIEEVLTATGNWTCPVGVHRVFIQIWGGGGGNNSASVLAGGGGEYAEGCYDVVPGTVYAYTIGAGGAGSGAGGSAGGNSSFGALIAANGGAAASSGAGGSGGAGGQLVIAGQAGTNITMAGGTPLAWGGFSPRGGGGGVGNNGGVIPGGGAGAANAGGNQSGAAGRIVLRY